MKEEDMTFKVSIDKETMRTIVALERFCRNHFPFIDKKFGEFSYKLETILKKGCFLHNTICTTVKESSSKHGDSYLTFCPKCSPNDAKKYSKEVKETLEYFGDSI